MLLYRKGHGSFPNPFCLKWGHGFFKLTNIIFKQDSEIEEMGKRNPSGQGKSVVTFPSCAFNAVQAATFKHQ